MKIFQALPGCYFVCLGGIACCAQSLMEAYVHAGIVYGLYLTLSSWVLYYVATHMTFFTDKCHLADLNTTDEVLRPYCQVSSPCT